MKKILITGGLGFVGSNLISKLELLKSVKINVIDKDKSKIFQNKKINLIRGDILDEKILGIASKNCDTIFHFAALTNIQDSLKNPKKYFLNNLIGTTNVVNAAIKNNSNLIFASSAAVYPLNVKKKISENYEFYPSNAYGLSKKLAEEYILSNKKKIKNFTIFRFFNIYGKRNTNKNYSGVITEFIKNTKKNKKMIINNGGKQVRDFINVDDVVQLCIEAANKKTNTVVNLGTGVPVRILDLAKTIKKIFKKGKIKISKKRKNHGDARFSCANIKLLEKNFPNIKFLNIENGLKKTISEK